MDPAPSPPPLVRPATAADVPAVLPMVQAICDFHHALDPERYGMLPDVVARYERWLPQRSGDPRSVFLVSEAGAEASTSPGLSGFLIATIETNIPIYTLREFGFIHDVFVVAPFRRRGHAAALVDAALARFAALGVSQVRLETAALNDSARRLFASRGFRIGTIDMLRTLSPGAA